MRTSGEKVAYAYRMEQNVLNRFHILIQDHCPGCFFRPNVIVSNAN